MDIGKYNAHSEREGAPTWTLVSTRHLLEAGSTYMDTGKYNAHPGSEGASTWTLVSTMHILNMSEHLHGYW
jgi:hypothetical protein